MPLPQRRVRFRHSRTAPNPEAGYNDEATPIKKTVRFGDIPETHVWHVPPLRFEQIVGTESADYWMGFAEDRMLYVKQLQVTLESFCEIEENAVLIQRVWRRYRGITAPPTWRNTAASADNLDKLGGVRKIVRSASTDQLIARTKQHVAQLKSSLRKSQQETYLEKLRIATLQAHQRALKRLELKKDRRRKKKRKAARHEEAAVQRQRAAEAELETERETAEAQQQSLSPFSWNLFGSTEVQVSATVGAPCLNSRTLKNMWDYRRTIRGFRHNYARSCCPQPVVANQQLLEAELAAAVACEMGQHTGELAAVLPVTLRVSSSLSPELRPADLVAARNIDLSELASLGESLANREAAVAISGCGGGGDIMLAEALRSFTTFTRAFDESGSSDSDSDVEVSAGGVERAPGGLFETIADTLSARLLRVTRQSSSYQDKRDAYLSYQMTEAWSSEEEDGAVAEASNRIGGMPVHAATRKFRTDSLASTATDESDGGDVSPVGTSVDDARLQDELSALATLVEQGKFTLDAVGHSARLNEEMLSWPSSRGRPRSSRLEWVEQHNFEDSDSDDELVSPMKSTPATVQQFSAYDELSPATDEWRELRTESTGWKSDIDDSDSDDEMVSPVRITPATVTLDSPLEPLEPLSPSSEMAALEDRIAGYALEENNSSGIPSVFSMAWSFD